MILAYLAVAAVIFATAGSASRLPARSAILWLLAVGVAYATLAEAGGGLLLLGAALLYGTIAFLLWLSVPMVIYTFFTWRPSAS